MSGRDPRQGTAAVTPGERVALTWELRIGADLGLPPFAAGALLALALMGATLLVQWALGLSLWNPDQAAILPFSPGVRAGFLLSLLIGYAVGAIGYAVRGVVNDLPRFGFRGAGPLWSLESRGADLTRSRVAGGIGALLGLAVDAFVAWRSWDTLDTEYACAMVLAPVLFWVVARSMYYSVVRTGQLAELIQGEIDLLNLRPLGVFVRIGLRHALLWIVAISVSLLYRLDARMAAPIVPLLVVTLGIAILTLVIPVRGVRRRIRAAKHTELELVDSKLRRLRDGALHGDGSDPGRLADLLAYRLHIASVREWPFDSSALVRFGLYLLIPLGSWFAGAFVERFVDSLLD